MKFANFQIGTRLYAAFGTIVFLFVAVIFSIFINFSRANDANELNIHSYDVISHLDATLNSLMNTETGERGFVMTGDASFLDSYNDGLSNFDQQTTTLKAIIINNSGQQERLQKLIDRQRHWVDNALKPVIAARRQAGQNIELIGSVMAMEQAGKGKADMDAMRLLLTEAKNTSSALLTERSQKVADIRCTRTTGTVS